MTRQSRQSFIVATIIATIAIAFMAAIYAATRTTLDLFPPTPTTEEAP